MDFANEVNGLSRQLLYAELTLNGKGVVLKTTSKDASPVQVRILQSAPKENKNGKYM